MRLLRRRRQCSAGQQSRRRWMIGVRPRQSPVDAYDNSMTLRRPDAHAFARSSRADASRQPLSPWRARISLLYHYAKA